MTALFGTRRKAVITLTIVGAMLILIPVVTPMVRRELLRGTVFTETQTVVVNDSMKHGSLNITLRAPRYIHSNDTAEIDILLERRGQGFPPAFAAIDGKLLDAFDDEQDVTNIDAELEAPAFTTLRITPKSNRPLVRTGWKFAMTPKPASDGKQLFVYRIRMLAAGNREVSYTSYF